MSRTLTISALLSLATMLLLFCRGTGELNKRNQLIAQKDSLLTQLHKNKNYIVSIRDSLSQLVSSRDDRITPARYLVYEGRANFVKAQARQLLADYSIWHPQIQPLEIIVESCEGQEVEWVIYCFGDMPYFGVEPILNVWIRQYELALAEVITLNKTAPNIGYGQ